VPGHSIWSRVSKNGVPANAVLMSCLLALLIVLPAFFASDKFVPPVAFFAVTAIGTVGLYIAYVTPVYLRWRAGDSFQQRSWNLGQKWRWINPVAVVFVVLMFIILCLPFSSLGVPWESDFDWSFFNYTPLVVGLVLLGTWQAWIAGAKNSYKGPIKTIEEDVATRD
jgi:amino acid permease